MSKTGDLDGVRAHYLSALSLLPSEASSMLLHGNLASLHGGGTWGEVDLTIGSLCLVT